MGSLFGGKLSLAGFDVVLYDIFREHVEKVQRDGLAIEDAASGAVTTARPAASSDPEAARGADVLIIFVKSTATEEAAARFVPLAGPGTIVLTLQNGLGNEAIIAARFGAGRTAAEKKHLTAAQAAKIAREAEVKRLGLIHYSPRYSERELKTLLGEAREIFPESFLTRDLQHIEMPFED